MAQSRTYWNPGEDFLQNIFHFPSFRDLPSEHMFDDSYWKINKQGYLAPACTWFFMAEIINDDVAQISFLRNKVDVRDREGCVCPISFYPESLGGFDFQTLKNGSTILVTNGQRHNFLDGSIGLRCEYLEHVSVIPSTISDLFQLSNIYHAKKDTRCWSCAKLPASSSRDSTGLAFSGSELKKCASCKMARYCTKECQTKDWREGHKRVCKAMPLFERLTRVDFRTFDDRSMLRL